MPVFKPAWPRLEDWCSFHRLHEELRGGISAISGGSIRGIHKYIRKEVHWTLDSADLVVCRPNSGPGLLLPSWNAATSPHGSRESRGHQVTRRIFRSRIHKWVLGGWIFSPPSMVTRSPFPARTCTGAPSRPVSLTMKPVPPTLGSAL
jgi:hypothetical protein